MWIYPGKNACTRIVQNSEGFFVEKFSQEVWVPHEGPFSCVEAAFEYERGM